MSITSGPLPHSVSDGVLKLWPDLDALLGHSEDFKKKTYSKIESTDNSITHVSLPFFYWHSENHSRLANIEDVLSFWNDHRYESTQPDIHGRLIVPLANTWGDELHEKISLAAFNITSELRERGGYKNIYFRTCVPISTRSLSDTCKSMFPLYQKSKEWWKPFSIVQVCAVIADIVTLPLRLLSLIPRWIYQHHMQKNLPLPEQYQVEFISEDQDLDLGKGTIMFHRLFESSEDSIFSRSAFHYYLGS